MNLTLTTGLVKGNRETRMSAIHPSTAGDDVSALYSRLNWRLLPFLVTCYMFAYLDRVNVGFAKLQMQTDLGFSDAAYCVGLRIFFLGYVLWGITSACMLFVRNVPAFYAMRFLLGVFEAGFAPGMIYYLSCWYGPARMARGTGPGVLAGAT